jgi:hypothetical protein
MEYRLSSSTVNKINVILFIDLTVLKEVLNI